MKRKTIAAFEQWKLDERSWEEFFHRVADGETVQEFCTSKSLAYSLVARHIAQTPLLKAQYDTALQLWGDALAQESVAIADEQKEATKRDGSTFDPDVARDKLRVDTRLRLAGKLDRERYGERDRPAVAVNISLGDVAREIRELESRLGIALGGPVIAEQLPAPARQSVDDLERI